LHPTGEMTSMLTMPAAIEIPAVAAPPPDSVLYLERQVKRLPGFPHLTGRPGSGRRGIAEVSRDGLLTADGGRGATETAGER